MAEIYDEWVAARASSAELAVDALAQLAGAGPILELGIGTGRVALPLAQRGLTVHGIDASEAMVAKLRAKPGGAAIPVTMGDFAEVGVPGLFSLIFVVFNTFFALATQEAQVNCFRHAAQHLHRRGVFVIEAFVPDLARFRHGQAVGAMMVDVNQVELDASRHDAVTQRVVAQHILLSAQGVRLYPVQLRYAWPAELDLMARLAQLRLRERWGGWQGEAFGPSSTQHVSIYQHEAPR